MKKKFSKLHNGKVLTDDPTILPAVRRSKTLRKEIIGKADMGGIYDRDTKLGK